MRQFSAGLTLYTQEHDGVFPPVAGGNSSWDTAILADVGNKGVFRCPSCPVPQSFDNDVPGIPSIVAKGYAINAGLYNADIRYNPAVAEVAVRYPVTTVSVCEVAFRFDPQMGAASTFLNLDAPDDGSRFSKHIVGSPGALRHQGGSNYAFVDGHTRWYKPQQVAGARQGNDKQHPSFAL